MTQQNQNDSNGAGKAPTAPKGFLGTFADLLKASSSGGAQRRPTGAARGGRPQPKKPCGGCGK